MSGLRGFLVFLGAIVVVGGILVWWVGPQMLTLAFDEEQRAGPLTVLHFADFDLEEQSRFLERYETPILGYFRGEGVVLRWQGTLEYASQGRVADEWKRVHQLHFDRASDFLQTVTSADFRDLSAGNVVYRRLIVAALGELPALSSPAIVFVLVRGVDVTGTGMADLTANLEDYGGEIAWDTVVDVFEIGAATPWDRLVAIGFGNVRDADGWLTDPGTRTERAVAAARYDRMATLLLRTASEVGVELDPSAAANL